MTTLQNIPLAKLVAGDETINSRKAKAPVESLMNSIKVHGLLVPLIVRKNGDDTYDVIDGNRRLEALNKLHPKSVSVPCIENLEGNALELSMVTNIDRVGLHPVDRFEVLSALIGSGEKIETIAKHYQMKVPEVRQALALGKLAPEVREVWRAGKLDEEVAEVFAMTSDHAAQVKALKKAGKHPSKWDVKRALMGDIDMAVDGMLKIVGRENYEKAGYEINASLFDEEKDAVVSDLPALKQMVDEKVDAKCADLCASGWKWAISKSEAPNDLYAWRRIHADGGKFSKEVMAECGCVVGFDLYGTGKLAVDTGYVRPGDTIRIPKTKTQKKAAAKAKEEKQGQTGGLSNALAERLSKQLTLAVREAVTDIPGQEIVTMVVAALASDNGPSRIVIGTSGELDRHNDFAKYLKLVDNKAPAERLRLLALWFAKSLDLTVHKADQLGELFDPGKDGDKSVKALAQMIAPKTLQAAILKNFDAADYFGSVSKELIVEAVKEKMGAVPASKVAAMKASDARDFAIKNLKGWVPVQLRLA